MSRKSLGIPKSSLRVTYSNGLVECVSGDAPTIRSRFVELVVSCVPNYVDGLKSIDLLDNSGRVFKSYSQM